MKTIDNRSKLFELEEIYKYKDLINLADKNVIKKIIFTTDEQSTVLYNKFLELVENEVNHQLNKAEFSVLKQKLIEEMKVYLKNI